MSHLAAGTPALKRWAIVLRPDGLERQDGQQRQHRAQFRVGEARQFAGKPQLQRLAQFIEELELCVRANVVIFALECKRGS